MTRGGEVVHPNVCCFSIMGWLLMVGGSVDD